MSEQLDAEDNRMKTIIVNGRERDLDMCRIAYSEVVVLAFGPTDLESVVTVTYRRGKGSSKSGTLTPGKTVHLWNGMIFNVAMTNKA